MMKESEILFHEMQIDTLARTAWGEARGEGSIGLQAVMAVVMNRLAVSLEKGRFWWGNSVIEICQKPYQFSCWNRDDPNYRKVLHVDKRDIIFSKAWGMARLALARRLPDPSAGATHYHADSVQPYWSRGHKPTMIIGHHVFYRILS